MALTDWIRLIDLLIWDENSYCSRRWLSRLWSLDNFFKKIISVWIFSECKSSTKLWMNNGLASQGSSHIWYLPPTFTHSKIICASKKVMLLRSNTLPRHLLQRFQNYACTFPKFDIKLLFQRCWKWEAWNWNIWRELTNIYNEKEEATKLLVPFMAIDLPFDAGNKVINSTVAK